MLYQQPDDKVMSLVKMEKSDRSEFRAKLKQTKLAGMKERLESIAYFDDNGNEELDAGNDNVEDPERRTNNHCHDEDSV